jgi:hypothetical protein
LNLKWKAPETPDGRHLNTEVIPISEYLAMRKRIAGRHAFMPKTNFASEPLDELKETDAVMKAFKGGYVFSSYSMEPETLLFLKSAIEMFRPRVILELGSGLSTLVLSHSHRDVLKADKAEGMYVTIEQSQELLDKLLEFSDLAKVRNCFTPLVFPLARYKIGDLFETDEKALPCFDLDEKALHKALGGLKPDMIIIDGPMDEKTLSGASFAKALTMPLLSLYASPNAVVLMDGAYGDPEIFSMDQWQQSGIAHIIGVKAVGKGLMLGLANG